MTQPETLNDRIDDIDYSDALDRDWTTIAGRTLTYAEARLVSVVTGTVAGITYLLGATSVPGEATVAPTTTEHGITEVAYVPVANETVPLALAIAFAGIVAAHALGVKARAEKRDELVEEWEVTNGDEQTTPDTADD